MFFYKQFEKFDPVSGDVPSHPFLYLPEIAHRARALLQYRTAAQITLIAKRISSEVDGYFDDLKYIAISQLKEELDPRDEEFERFFDWDGSSKIENGRWLLKDGMENELDIPTAENTSEVDALKTIIENRDSCFFLPEGAPEPEREEWAEGTRYELFAAMSLWLLADAMEYIDDKSKHGLSIAGEYAIKAMDAVCYAEHLHQEDWLVSFIKKTSNAKLAEALHKQKLEWQKWVQYCEKIDKEKKSEQSKKAADARHGQPGGYRDKKKELLDIWGSGKYRSRNDCADNEYRKLGLSRKTTRDHLQGTPNPNPWPAKSK
ncbi:hypothetical protein ANRL1_03473 [Anaerolineae bacterium]|nr:hypothetical protein ANRL1_03473 [Anaerolineae bacterium]